jgi:V/A-type H+-transporting ATPase subunit C
MNEGTLQKLEQITEIREFVDFISRYYPGLNFNTYSIEDLEKALFHNYIKLIGKIIQYSPSNMRIFLRDYLMKYEIMNIKRVILGTILGMNATEKSSMVNKLVEKYLNHADFINELIEIPSLDELQLFMRSTRYNRVIREGILYFKNTNEIFVLETFLDQLYYNNMRRDMKHLNMKEKMLISLYTEYISEIYNLNLIYRGIINNVDRNLILQLLVDSNLFFDKEIILKLMNLTNIEDFTLLLNQHLRNNKEIRSYLLKSPLNQEHLIWSLEKLYLDYYFKTFEMKLDDIEYEAIYKILEVIIKKDKEIRLYILPKIVDILHEKYQSLK